MKTYQAIISAAFVLLYSIHAARAEPAPASTLETIRWNVGSVRIHLPMDIADKTLWYAKARMQCTTYGGIDFSKNSSIQLESDFSAQSDAKELNFTIQPGNLTFEGKMPTFLNKLIMGLNPESEDVILGCQYELSMSARDAKDNSLPYTVGSVELFKLSSPNKRQLRALFSNEKLNEEIEKSLVGKMIKPVTYFSKITRTVNGRDVQELVPYQALSIVPVK